MGCSKSMTSRGLKLAMLLSYHRQSRVFKPALSNSCHIKKLWGTFPTQVFQGQGALIQGQVTWARQEGRHKWQIRLQTSGRQGHGPLKTELCSTLMVHHFCSHVRPWFLCFHTDLNILYGFAASASRCVWLHLDARVSCLFVVEFWKPTFVIFFFFFLAMQLGSFNVLDPY